MRARLLLPLLLLATTAVAQSRTGKRSATTTAAGGAALSGVVFDSLIDLPLSGATIVISASAVTATSDSVGHYELPLDSVAEGRHEVAFFHPRLDSMGIAPPPHTIDVHRGASLVADLAVPSGPTIVRAVCPDSVVRHGGGLLLGDVRDAESDQPLVGAYVVVMWSGMSVGNSTISRVQHAMNVRTDSEGLYRLCGVPAQTPLRAQARTASKASGWIELQIDRAGVIVQQFLVGERPVAAAPAAAPGAPAAAAGAGSVAATAAPAGSAVLTGTVIGPDGAPLEGAQVLLIGAGVSPSTRADYKGAFRLTGLPAGTHTVEVRLLSYQPKRYVVNLSPRREVRLAAVLDQRAQVLDPVTVIAKETTPIPGFDDRKAHATGTFFTKKQIEAANPISVSDLMRRAPGMQVLFVNGVYQVVSARGGANECNSVTWIVDGVRYVASEDEDMDDIVKPYEVEAIEVYASAVDTPMQFQGSQSRCGTIVIWTNRAHVKPKAKTAATTTSDTSKTNH